MKKLLPQLKKSEKLLPQLKRVNTVVSEKSLRIQYFIFCGIFGRGR